MSKKKETPPASPKELLRITVGKNIVGGFASVLEESFKRELENATVPVILDLSAITTIDSGGIALCIGLFRECEKKNISLTIEAGPELCRFLRMISIERIITISEKGGGA